MHPRLTGWATRHPILATLLVWGGLGTAGLANAWHLLTTPAKAGMPGWWYAARTLAFLVALGVGAVGWLLLPIALMDLRRPRRRARPERLP